MRKLYRYGIPALVGIALLGGTPIAMAATGGGTTGQSVWAGFGAGGGTFGYTDRQTFTFDGATAATNYTNVLNSSAPTVGCSGSSTNCALGNQPVAPSAPATDAGQVSSLVTADRCTFYAGGQLSSSSYTLSRTVNGVNGKGNWTFTWTYAVSGSSVAPETAWSSVLDGSGGAHVTLGGEIAGESVLSKSSSDRKYSFSLLDNGGASRVSGLSITLTDPDGNVGSPVSVGSTVVNAAGSTNFHDFSVGTDTSAFPDDLHLDALVTTNGNTGLLATGDARAILGGDTFAGNNNGGADGSALAYAALNPTDVTLTEGEWTATLAGTVKDNTGAAQAQLAVHRHLVIIGLNSCTRP
jgi:hypothetical protein